MGYEGIVLNEEKRDVDWVLGRNFWGRRIPFGKEAGAAPGCLAVPIAG